ncbi:cell wall metabolism sensor histidine kinase WalK [Microbacterium sp. RURRCA19A]|uniref:sensor histidine kinase n=1 Tax=Microbacterium sp. RURRCA19A TaxID=1907391 RepID=UPI000953BE0E|nr:HAMP domain-containing sensor histidine kinase [Microbacterium sp. RURRCA19A]SIS09727.1 two-component system, OmpR family, sensor kinase [Microbacterium sp. RURRCA19A]
MSLRTKVTGVTVTLLAVGLVAAGIGTLVFLRTTLIDNLDEQLKQQAASNIANSVFVTNEVDGGLAFTQVDNAPPIGSMVVVYGPDAQRVAFYNGTGAKTVPQLPDTFSVEQTYSQVDRRIELEDPVSGQHFLARVGLLQVPGNNSFYTQMVVQPLAPTDRIVAAYVGIYGFVALLILIASALLTRALVTLTFRSLGQVETTAMDIAAGDFSQRLTDIVPDTEVGRLKAAINAMLARIDGALTQRDATVRQMRRFIGDASHELRTPLVTMRGYAELYRMGAIRSDEDVAQAMERIEKEAIRMGALVEDLLALARLDERRDVAITTLDLRPIARDAALDLRVTSPQREVTVDDTTSRAAIVLPVMRLDPELPAEDGSSTSGRRRTAPTTSAMAIAGATLSRLRRRRDAADSPAPETENVSRGTADAGPPPRRVTSLAPIVLGDENRVRQVVANLLGNARRFTADDSPIGLRVGVDAETDMGWIEIIDHGEGVPEQIREQIFQRFWRADTSRTRETGGSGLGLSIVASIVDLLHGKVEVLDTPGGGATFRVSLPLAERRDASEHALITTQPLERLPEALRPDVAGE